MLRDLPPYRPRLREELSFEEGGAVLADRVVGRRVNLGPLTRRIAPRLDGTRPLAAILDELEPEAAALGAGRDTVEHAFRSFLLMNLVEGAGDAIVRRVHAASGADPPLAPRFLDGSR